MKLFAASIFCGISVLLCGGHTTAATLDHEAVAAGKDCAKALFRFWCPDDLATVRGVAVLVPGQDSDGRTMVEDAVWQRFACKHKLALVGCDFEDKPHGENVFVEGYAQASRGSGQALLDALAAFAKASKHAEVASAPLVLWGHSAGGQFNYEFTCWKPERVIAFVANKGGVYFTHLAPEAARRVPAIFFIGENDSEFRKMSIYGVYAMNRRLHAPWTLAVEPNAGHEVGRTREMAIAFFDAVLPLRLPAPATMSLAELKEESGWVGDLKSLQLRPGKMKDNQWSTWLPSESVARAWVSFVQGQPIVESQRQDPQIQPQRSERLLHKRRRCVVPSPLSPVR
jgi:dienelactone hydrolase